MKLKDKEIGLMIVTLVKGLQKLYEAREIPNTIGTVYLKMITPISQSLCILYKRS